MTIHIQQERLITDIQQEFNKAYPFLKIGFFASRHGYKQGSPDKEKLAPHRMLKEVAGNLEEQIIDVQDTMSVHELEHLFRTLLGLHVQVFRKSGNLWLETTITDSWTLKQQNDHGREISLPPVIPITIPQKTADNQ